MHAVTWRTVHEHTVADAFRSKNLRRAHHYYLFTFSTHYLCSRRSFFCSHQKQLNGHLKSIILKKLVVHEQVALMSSS